MLSLIKIPMSLFPLKMKDFKYKIELYALDANTIGIAKSFSRDWATVALWRKTWHLQKSGSNFIFNIPQRLRRFYKFDSSSKITTSINGDRILITITKK